MTCQEHERPKSDNEMYLLFTMETEKSPVSADRARTLKSVRALNDHNNPSVRLYPPI